MGVDADESIMVERVAEREREGAKRILDCSILIVLIYPISNKQAPTPMGKSSGTSVSPDTKKKVT